MKKKILIGLTGGLASGKSFVLKIFAALGAKTIDSDKIVHNLLKKDKYVIKRVINFFGRKVLNKSNNICRSRLGGLVFSNPKKLKRLEKIIHPVVLEVIRKEVNKSKKRINVVDVPLLFEAGWQRFFDYIALAWCGEELQVKRVMRRNNLSREQAYKRMKLQMPMEAKIKKADFIIDTSKTRDAIKKYIKATIDKL